MKNLKKFHWLSMEFNIGAERLEEAGRLQRM